MKHDINCTNCQRATTKIQAIDMNTIHDGIRIINDEIHFSQYYFCWYCGNHSIIKFVAKITQVEQIEENEK